MPSKLVNILRFAFDLLPDFAAIFLALLLSSVALAVVFLPEEIKRLEERRKARLIIAGLLLLLGIFCGGGGVVSDLLQKAQESERSKAERDEAKKAQDNLTAEVNKLLDQQTLTLTQMQIVRSSVNAIPIPKVSPQPDLKLVLVYPEAVAVDIFNAPTAGVANKPKYQFVLADLDNLEANLLPIPAAEGDYIRPGEYWGPEAVMSLRSVKSIVKAHDHIFGYATVMCPDCVKTRAYWVYIEQGSGGWYCEMTKYLFPYSLSFFRQVRENRDVWLEQLAPENTRIAILNPN